MQAIQVFIKWLFWLMLGSVIVATAVMYALNKKEGQAVKLPQLGEIPQFEFVSHHGEPFGRAQLNGKISVVDFIFTNCGAACPRMTMEMSELYHEFAKTAEVQFISISTDPENDTLERLQEFARGYGVTDSRWAFLRGSIEEVSALAEQGFKLSGDFPANHSTKFVLVDALGKIRGYYDSFDPESLEKLRSHIRALLQ